MRCIFLWFRLAICKIERVTLFRLLQHKYFCGYNRKVGHYEATTHEEDK